MSSHPELKAIILPPETSVKGQPKTIGGTMKKILILSVLVLLAGCGGSKIQLNNGTGLDLETVTLTIADNSQSWQNIQTDKTFGSDISIPAGSAVIYLEWETAEEQWSMEYVTIDSASRADKISILFAAEEMSVNYSF